MAGRGPGPVATAHRVLIATGLVGALVFAGWEVREYGRTGAPTALVAAALGLVVAIGLGLYLWSLRGLAARLTAGDDRG
jgi:uncharacterized protein (DUF849 family)